jgi:hypothetical protein
MRIPIPFVGTQSSGRSSKVNDQLTRNLYVQVEKPGAKNTLALYGDPGVKALVIAGIGPCRSNGEVWQDKLYFVSGGSLISIDANQTVTTIGTLNTSNGWCVLAAGVSYLGLVDGIDGYSWNGSTFAAVSDADFPGNPTHITWLDSFFIVNDSGTDNFYKSDGNDMTAWTALQFASAEAKPDNCDALIANTKDLYILGPHTTQIYYNSGNADFPFDPYPNGVFEYGIAAPSTLVQCAMGLFWLARTKDGNAVVVRAGGLQVQEISHEDINWQIGSMTTFVDANAYVYQMRGKWYYVINFPTEDKTFCYMIREQFWYERKSPLIGRHRGNGYGFMGNKHVLGDYGAGGAFYELDFSTYTDAGEYRECTRRTQVTHKSGQEMTFNELIIDMETGVGITGTGQGSDPVVVLRYSDDGGNIWSNEIEAKMGKIGEYNTRVGFTKLGSSFARIFELKITDPVEVVIMAAYADITLARY